ncbi:MAG: hypothetical protein ACOX4T_10220 [Acetivibrionales bacterium]|jgi:hypothetical protein
MNWWNELTGLQQILASVAIPATLVMMIQFILLLFGFTGDSGDSADVGDISDGVDVGDITDGVDVGDIDVGEAGYDFIDSTDGVDIAEHGDFDTDSGTDPSGYAADNAAQGADALKLFTLRGIIGFFSIGGWFGVAAISWGIPAPGALALAFVAGYLALYFVAWSIRTALRLQHSGNININNAIGNNGEVYIPIPPEKSGVGKVSVIVQDRLCELSAVTNAERTLKTGEKITVMGIEKEGVLLVAPKNPPEGVIIENEF